LSKIKSFRNLGGENAVYKPHLSLREQIR
jgi:hypothetical protein